MHYSAVRWCRTGIMVLALGPTGSWPQLPHPAGPPQLIWENPDRRPKLARDLSDPDKRPQAPFRFVEEDLGGTNPKVKVRDKRGRLWIVKWAEEKHSEIFASRLAAALGYFSRPAFYVREGIIEGVRDLGRAAPYVAEDGAIRDAAFKLISDRMPYAARNNWAWIDNPFLDMPVGRRQFNGLKIVLMLTSNWDTKDTRDAAFGPNTAIYRTTGKGETVRYLYAVDDWGAAMGRWGNFFKREKWHCEGFTAQTPEFVQGVEDGFVKWGYTGKNTKEITEGITVDDVRWLLEYLRKITDQQIEAALRSSGADADEAQCFRRALRERINQLKAVAGRESSRANIGRHKQRHLAMRR